MLFLQRIPKTIRWILSVLLILLLVMTISRFFIYFRFNPPGKAFSGSAFILGLRYDARVLGIIGICMLLLLAIPALHPFKNNKATSFWNFLLPLVFITMLVVFAIDYYHFDYLHQRLNATVLNYLQDAGISLSMMWQSYPLFIISIGFLFLIVLARVGFEYLLSRFQQQDSFYKRKGKLMYVLAYLVFAGLVFGKAGQFPLRWSDAYTLSDDFKANLALNPFQSFLSTLNFRNSSYDIKKVKSGYATMVDYLGIENPNHETLNFERTYPANGSNISKPNIVLVLCESFSSYKSSMHNNPLNSTPFFNEMCKDGIFFDRCFTPAYGTARGVWATLTGLPDVESPKTASRNPNAVDQRTIINDFKGYNNFYFLGGSATWANIRGVITNNITNVKLYEQEDYKAPKVDVWGISDKNLMLEANGVLKQQQKPFFAIIQTADNHRPYTIPEEDKAVFKLVQYSNDSLKRFGFESNEELNAFRYTDFGFQQFMEAAKKESYFKNTIFVFVGDHGIRYNGTLDYFPKSWTEQGLTCEHVPLLFYAPAFLKPKRVNDVCSQVDILPSVASLAGIAYKNNSLGRNLFSPLKQNHAFIIDHDVKTIGMISNSHYYLRNYKTGKEEIVSMTDNATVLAGKTNDSIKNKLQQLTDAYYETAKYLLLNNKKKQ